MIKINKDILVSNPDLIKDVQKIQIELLREFDRICRENNLPYNIFGGTLLGAVRHGGFIPWDDDIDVAMLRKDYNKFIEISKKELSDEYFLQTIQSDPETFALYGKLRKNNTKFVEKHVSHLNMHHGVYIDIFPLDNIVSSIYDNKLKYLNLLYKIHIFTHKNKSHIATKNFLLKDISNIVVNKKMKFKLKNKLDKLFQRHNDSNALYINHLTNSIDEGRFKRFLFTKKEFLDTQNFYFEGIQVLGPKNYDNLLTQLYGDYMSLPPIEDQVPHHGVIKLEI